MFMSAILGAVNKPLSGLPFEKARGKVQVQVTHSNEEFNRRGQRSQVSIERPTWPLAVR